MRPPILVMDEPTAGLDPAGALEIADLLKQLNEEGTTLVLVTHDMDLVARLSHRVIALDNGRIGLDGTPCEIFRDPEKLSRLNLGLPEAARVAFALRESGWPIPMDAITGESMINAVQMLLPK